ncbi:MAG: YARHG domain-containing protein [Succinivibrio sp.]|nr:YARHG domain-containing protein [Succinivibrio sp.]
MKLRQFTRLLPLCIAALGLSAQAENLAEGRVFTDYNCFYVAHPQGEEVVLEGRSFKGDVRNFVLLPGTGGNLLLQDNKPVGCLLPDDEELSAPAANTIIGTLAHYGEGFYGEDVLVFRDAGQKLLHSMIEYPQLPETDTLPQLRSSMLMDVYLGDYVDEAGRSRLKLEKTSRGKTLITFRGHSETCEFKALPNGEIVPVIELKGGSELLLELTVQGLNVYQTAWSAQGRPERAGLMEELYHQERGRAVHEGRWSFTGEVIIPQELCLYIPKGILRLMRNEILARHRHIFYNTDLKDYFSLKPWYNPSKNETTINPVEKLNMEILQFFETHDF